MLETITLQRALSILRDNPTDVNGADSARTLIEHGTVTLPDIGQLSLTDTHERFELEREPKPAELSIRNDGSAVIIVPEQSPDVAYVNVYHDDAVRIKLSANVVTELARAWMRQGFARAYIP